MLTVTLIIFLITLKGIRKVLPCESMLQLLQNHHDCCRPDRAPYYGWPFRSGKRDSRRRNIRQDSVALLSVPGQEGGSKS
jgi:hypothetical protein